MNRRYKRIFRDLSIMLLLLTASLYLGGCGRKDCSHVTRSEGYDLDKIEKATALAAIKDSTQLIHKLQMAKAEDNAVDQMLIAMRLGSLFSDNSQFSRAIQFHRVALSVASNITDTMEMIRANNLLGRDFRRIGMYPNALTYHYKALSLSNRAGTNVGNGKVDTSLIRNRVRALNGIGNVCLSLNDGAAARDAFSLALKQEVDLKNPFGMAINEANIGAILEKEGKIDSAMIYFVRSMKNNRLAGSKLGIALSYLNIGRIREGQGDKALAKEDFDRAYLLLRETHDKWHWLESIIALARLHLSENNPAAAIHYIDSGLKTAAEINSTEHLSKIYELKGEYYEKTGRYADALAMSKESRAWTDSLIDTRIINQYTDLRLNYQEGLRQAEIDRLNSERRAEASMRKMQLLISITIVIMLLSLLGTLVYRNRLRSRSNKSLRQFERIRTSFFTNMTHEFRTPLTVIIGISDRYSAEKMITTDAERVSAMQSVNRQGRYLLDLINRILEMNKLEAGGTKPDWRKGLIAPFVTMVAETYSVYVETKGLKLGIKIEDDVRELQPVFVPMYINHILQNLLFNAIKYTPPGGSIEVSLSRSSTPESYKIAVSDTGPGIKADEINKIFDLFNQGAKTDRTMGSGIGLALCRTLCKLMNGQIRVESELGHGSTFIVEIPIEPASSQGENIRNLSFKDITEEAEHTYLSEKHESCIKEGYFPHDEIRKEKETLTPGAEDADKKPLVLIVEDNKDVANFIALLIHEEYNYLIASDGEEGISKAFAEMPDLIVTDLVMPRVDGLELCTRLKSNSKTSHIPIIMLTARSSIKSRLTGLSSGADVYLCKPLYGQELMLQIARLLSTQNLLRKKYSTLTIIKDEQGNFADVQGLNTALASTSSASADSQSLFLHRVNESILSHISDPNYNGADLAADVSLSISQLNRRLNASIGCSASVYVRRLRLKSAEDYILKTNHTLTEIASMCGFSDYTTFARNFKAIMGKAPSDLREERLTHEHSGDGQKK